MAKAPYLRTVKTPASLAADFTISLVPVLIWAVYLFGARVLTLAAISCLFCFGADFLWRRYYKKYPVRDAVDPFCGVYGLLLACMLPVAVPLWIPMIGALVTVVGKNLRVFGDRKLFCPPVLGATLLGIAYPGYLRCFTRPFAYFNAFSFSIDGQLVDAYRVISPLQLLGGGQVYEDGVIPQFYGYASGCIGEVAVAAILLGAVYLLLRRAIDFRPIVSCLATVFAIAYVFPSEDAETIYYTFSAILAGGLILLSVYACNDYGATPVTARGKIIFGAGVGALTMLFRAVWGGFEGAYPAVLLMNAASPLLDRFAARRPFGALAQRASSRRGKSKEARG